MNLAELYDAIGDALRVIPEVVAGDWQVLDAPYDAFDPPALVVVGANPFGEARSVCADMAQYEVLVLAARLTPEATYPALIGMIDTVRNELADARLRPASYTAPGPVEVASITYLGARLLIRRPVDIEGDT